MTAAQLARPPVDVEQWLDFVIAAEAHRSHNEGQREFGRVLINRYFVNLTDAYREDPVARAYLDNMLCAVASAIRQFSIVRDTFGTRWEALLEAKERDRQRAAQLAQFSPLRRDSFWKQMVTVLSAFGLLTVLLAGLQSRVASLPWAQVLLLAIGVVLAVFGLTLGVDELRLRRLKKSSDQLVMDLEKDWRTQALPEYKKAAYQFLLSAIKIREEFYPGLATIGNRRIFASYAVPHIECGIAAEPAQGNPEDLEGSLEAIIERHFTH